MADYDDHAGASSTSSAHGRNIPILLGIENYSIWATRMRFSLGRLQAVGLIDADPPRIGNGGFSAANVRLTGQVLSLITSKMGDVAMDLAGKELWSRALAQYYEKRWGAKYIFFEKLVQLRHSDCESTGVTLGSFVIFPNVCPTWDAATSIGGWSIYFLVDLEMSMEHGLYRFVMPHARNLIYFF